MPSFKFDSSNISTSTVLGFYAGVFGNYAFTEKLSLQPELIYATGGGKYSYDYGSAGMARPAAEVLDDQIKTSSLSIPVMLQYKVFEGLYFEAGPQYNFLLSMKENYNGYGYEDIKEYYKTGTFGVAVGTGYDLSVLVAGLKIQARYIKDLSKMNKDDLEGGDKLKASRFQAGLAYVF